jgi:hypothetical protein
MVLVVMVAAGAGCSSSVTTTPTGSGGSATVHGTVNGRSISTADTIALTGTMGGQSEIAIVIGGPVGWCSAAQRNYVPANQQSLLLVVVSQSTVTIGTYQVLGDHTSSAGGGYSSSDYADQITGGTLTLTSAGPAAVTGSFDMTMVSGDRVTGTFDSPVCSAPLPYVNGL